MALDIAPDVTDQGFKQNPMNPRYPYPGFQGPYGLRQEENSDPLFGVERLDAYQRLDRPYTKPKFDLSSETFETNTYPPRQFTSVTTTPPTFPVPTQRFKPVTTTPSTFPVPTERFKPVTRTPSPLFGRSKSVSTMALKKPRLQKIHSFPGIKSESGDWLEDSIMDKAMSIVKKHFPHILGLQETCVASVTGQHGLNQHSSKFLQIVNTKGNHWILLSNIGWDHHHVRVFDSCYRKLNPDTRSCIVSLVPANQNLIKVLMPAYQRQENKSDCGLFAVAAMFALALGNDPSKCYWDSKKMRSFLNICLQSESCQMFPSSQTRVKQLREKEYDIEVCRSCCRFPSDNAMLRLCSNCQTGSIKMDENMF